jgi:hypothetical protein
LKKVTMKTGSEEHIVLGLRFLMDSGFET